MTNRNTLQHSVTAALGAMMISTLFVVAAIGPAHAVETAPVQTATIAPSAQAHA